MSETKPALTPEEWDNLDVDRGLGPQDPWLYFDADSRELVVSAGPAGVGAAHLPDPERHAVAALALHGRAFGFTWADVMELRSTAKDCVRHSRPDLYPKLTAEDHTWYAQRAAHFHGLADRIAALLPPREP